MYICRHRMGPHSNIGVRVRVRVRRSLRVRIRVRVRVRVRVRPIFGARVTNFIWDTKLFWHMQLSLHYSLSSVLCMSRQVTHSISLWLARE